MSSAVEEWGVGSVECGVRSSECGVGSADWEVGIAERMQFAIGLVTLGLASDDAYGKVWHLPALPAETTRAWIDRFAAAFGLPAPRLSTIGPWAMHLAGLFVPEAGELPEMMYQWQAPFRLDDSRFRATFGASPTPLDEAVRATAAWARATWGKRDKELATA